MKTLLALDTSSSTPSLALKTEETLAVWSPQAGQPLSQTLLPALQDLLDKAQTTFPALDGIVACTGPGIFTGIRVGLATLKGLLAPHPHIPVWPACTLSGWALQIPPQTPDPVRVVLDARRGQVYTALFSWQEDLLHLLEEPRLLPQEEIRSLPPTLLVGTFPPPLSEWLEGCTQPWNRGSASPILAPHLLGVPTRLATSPVSSANLHPRYLRPADAQPPAACTPS